MRHDTILLLAISMLVGTQPAYCKTVLGMFNSRDLHLNEDGSYTGTTEPTPLGPVTFGSCDVFIDGNDQKLSGPIELRETSYHITLERDHRDEDALEHYDRYIGTISAPDGGTPYMFGVPLYDTHVILNTKTQILDITGTCHKYGLALEVNITAHLTDSLGISVGITVADIKSTWYPFANTDLPETLRKIHITDIGVGFKGGISLSQHSTATYEDVADANDIEHDLFGALVISGTLHALYVATDVEAEAGLINGEPGIALVAQMPHAWHICDSFPHIAETSPGKILDKLTFSDARCVITSYETYTISDREYWRGCNIEARVHKTDQSHPLLERIFGQFGNTNPSLFIKGCWSGEDPRDLYLRTGTSSGKFGFTLGPASFFDGSVFFEISGNPACGIGSSCKMRMATDEVPLEWYVGVTATPSDIAVSGSMRNTWHNPFGAPGIHIRNLGLKGSQSYATLAEIPETVGIAALIPSQAGVSGEGDICLPDDSNITFDVKANLGKNVLHSALYGYLRSSVSLHSLTRLLLRNITDADTSYMRIPDLQLEQVCLQFVPLGTYIGQIRVEQGVGVSCYVNICGKRAYIDIGTSLSELGLHLYGHMPKIDAGPVHITGYDAENPDTGPTLDTVLTLNKQHLNAHGRITIEDIFERDHTITISRDGISFAFDHTLGPLELHVDGTTEHIAERPHDFTLNVAFTDNTIAYIHHLIKKLIHRNIMYDDYGVDVSLPRSMSDIIDTHPHIIEKLASFLHIDHMYVHGSAYEIVHGSMPYVHVTAHIAGKRTEGNFQFDFKHPRKSLRHIILQLLNMVIVKAQHTETWSA